MAASNVRRIFLLDALPGDDAVVALCASDQCQRSSSYGVNQEVVELLRLLLRDLVEQVEAHVALV